MKQTISEIIDRRLDQQALDAELSAIVHDGNACMTWRNYHLIGDVIRGEVSGGTCMLYRMESALEKEPTVLAPASGSNVASAPIKSGLSSDAARSAGLFAIAASLALVAVLTLSPQSSVSPTLVDGGTQNGTQNEVNNTEIVSIEAVPGTGLTPEDQARASAFESEFGQMLVEHGEFTATSGLNGLIAYAKMVSNQQLGQ